MICMGCKRQFNSRWRRALHEWWVHRRHAVARINRW